MKHLLSSTALLVALCIAPAAGAEEITLVAPGGIQAAVQQLIPGFERATGHTVKATFGSGLGTKRQIAAGEPFDVPIIQPPYPEVISSGHVVADSATRARDGGEGFSRHDQTLRNQTVGRTSSGAVSGPRFVTVMRISRSSGVSGMPHFPR